MTKLASISRTLSRALEGVADDEPSAPYVYDPLGYAWAPHETYLSRFGAGKKQVVLLGMNPGPFGMAQTGVPFGDVEMVRAFLGIRGEVGQPPRQHPKRPVLGFACPRREVSGTRLWGLVSARFGTPERFAERFFVANYCPLLFLDEGGRNVTPNKLAATTRRAIDEACDVALSAVVDALDPEWVIGVGAFAEKRALRLGGSRRVASIPHPSPASPRANRGWGEAVLARFDELGVAFG